MSSNRNPNVAVIVGISLVLIGGWLLATKVLGPVFAPFEPLFNAVGYVLWPVVLIAIGALLIMRGQSNATTVPQPGVRRVYRSRTSRVVTGLIAGVAEYLGASPNVLRIIFTVLTIMSGLWAGVAVYVIASLIVPEEPFGEPVAAPSVPAQPVPPAPPVPVAPADVSNDVVEPPVPPAPPAPPVPQD